MPATYVKGTALSASQSCCVTLPGRTNVLWSYMKWMINHGQASLVWRNISLWKARMRKGWLRHNATFIKTLFGLHLYMPFTSAGTWAYPPTLRRGCRETVTTDSHSSPPCVHNRTECDDVSVNQQCSCTQTTSVTRRSKEKKLIRKDGTIG